MATLRRVVVSKEFNATFGPINWPEQFSPHDEIGAMIPILGRRMSRPRSLGIRDANGVLHECIGEAFTQGHQVFVLIHNHKSLTRATILL